MSSNNSPDESIYLRYADLEQIISRRAYEEVRDSVNFFEYLIDLSRFSLFQIIKYSIQSIASLNDDVFKNRNFATQLVDVLKHTLDNGELIDIELIAGTDNKR